MTLLVKALPLRAPIKVRAPIKALAWFLLLAAGGLVWADNPMFNGIETEMTAPEQAASGVDQLSPEQLKALNAWLANRFGGQPQREHTAADTYDCDSFFDGRRGP